MTTPIAGRHRKSPVTSRNFAIRYGLTPPEADALFDLAGPELADDVLSAACMALARTGNTSAAIYYISMVREQARAANTDHLRESVVDRAIKELGIYPYESEYDLCVCLTAILTLYVNGSDVIDKALEHFRFKIHLNT